MCVRKRYLTASGRRLSSDDPLSSFMCRVLYQMSKVWPSNFNTGHVRDLAASSIGGIFLLCKRHKLSSTQRLSREPLSLVTPCLIDHFLKRLYNTLLTAETGRLTSKRSWKFGWSFRVSATSWNSVAGKKYEKCGGICAVTSGIPSLRRWG